MSPTSVAPQRVAAILDALTAANPAHARHTLGPTAGAPVHTVYGGAHLFRPDTAQRLGALALRHLRTYAPDPATFAAALGLGDDEALAATVYARTAAKLAREPVEDFRIDFEDGFGPRSDAEEDGAALAAADAVAQGLAAGTLPPRLGIRIRGLTPATQTRAARTADLFVTRLLAQAGRLPAGFVVALPKVASPAQVSALADLLDAIERAVGLPDGSVVIELMVELTAALLDSEGRSALPHLVRAARGRCVGAHFGAYDFTASAGITAADQALDHPLCDVARAQMTLALAGTGVALSDGATNVLPIGPHRDGGSLSEEQMDENRAVVHAAWRRHYDNIRHALRAGFTQGWDLHPGQLPVRFAAVQAHALEGLASAGERLAHFVAQAARATLTGSTFDDEASGQGLLNTVLRALQCGAIDAGDLAALGLTREAIETRSFRVLVATRSAP